MNFKFYTALIKDFKTLLIRILRQVFYETMFGETKKRFTWLLESLHIVEYFDHVLVDGMSGGDLASSRQGGSVRFSPPSSPYLPLLHCAESASSAADHVLCFRHFDSQAWGWITPLILAAFLVRNLMQNDLNVKLKVHQLYSCMHWNVKAHI